MNVNIKHKFQSLEYQREYLFTLLRDINSYKANLQLAPDTWSLAQIYYHLYLVEKRVFDDITKRLKSHHLAEPAGLKEGYRLAVLKLFLGLPLKFKAPRAVKDSIPDQVVLDDLNEEWTHLRQAFELLLNVNSDEQLNLKLFKHPRVGLLSIIQAIDFIKAHHKHHLPQIKNLLSKNSR